MASHGQVDVNVAPAQAGMPGHTADREIGEDAVPALRSIPATLSVMLPAILHPEADGGYWAEVPALPGCVTQGDSLEEVVANVREAAEGWLLANHDRQTGASPATPAPR